MRVGWDSVLGWGVRVEEALENSLSLLSPKLQLRKLSLSEQKEISEGCMAGTQQRWDSIRSSGSRFSLL